MRFYVSVILIVITFGNPLHARVSAEDYIQERFKAAADTPLSFYDLYPYILSGGIDIAAAAVGLSQFRGSKIETRIALYSGLGIGTGLIGYSVYRYFQTSPFTGILKRLNSEKQKTKKRKAYILKAQYLAGELARQERLNRMFLGWYEIVSGGIYLIEVKQHRYVSILLSSFKIVYGLWLAFFALETRYELIYQDLMRPRIAHHVVPVCGPDGCMLSYQLRF